MVDASRDADTARLMTRKRSRRTLGGTKVVPSLPMVNMTLFLCYIESAPATAFTTTPSTNITPYPYALHKSHLYTERGATRFTSRAYLFRKKGESSSSDHNDDDDGGLYSNVFDIYPFHDDPLNSLELDDDQWTPQNDDDAYMMDPTRTWIDETYKYFPALLPVIAYLAYDPTAELFASFLDVIGQANNWVAVDGGAYQGKIIAPAINGVVVPAISILFANLIGTTITTLRQRQLNIHTAVQMEAGQLRILLSILETMQKQQKMASRSDKDVSSSCQRYLTQYTTRLIAESQPHMMSEPMDKNYDYSLDTELNAVMQQLNQLTIEEAANVSGILLDQAHGACAKLYEQRANRITALKAQFPSLHFVILGALASSICLAFLLETKQDILVFLNAIQLRVLWTMLVGTFTALAIVCYDLSNPFGGSYRIPQESINQLYSIRMTLRASLRTKKSRDVSCRPGKQMVGKEPTNGEQEAESISSVPDDC